MITSTAATHFSAWKRTFDAVLKLLAKARQDDDHQDLSAFTQEDYLKFVDGRPRYDGANAFIRSRNINDSFIPWGNTNDKPLSLDTSILPPITICGIGNTKDQLFKEIVSREGAEVFPGSLQLLNHLKFVGIRCACASSSKNAELALKSSGIRDLFDALVDGNVLERDHMPGKPNPAMFLRAFEMITIGTDIELKNAAVFEDATVGVEAGKKGGFGIVIGVDRGGNRAELLKHGADIVVLDLEELNVSKLDSLLVQQLKKIQDYEK